MPIRINLLAEAQELELERQRDPVKRAIWIGAALVILMVAWCSSLQLKAIVAKGELNKVESQLSSRTNEFQQVLDNQKKLADVDVRLGKLHLMATNRLLYGTLLNALQQTTIDDVQLIRMRAEQNFVLNEEIKAKTNANGRLVPGKPATVTEKTVLTLDARDTGANPGDQVNKFKKAVADAPYFRTMLGGSNEVRLTSLSAPQTLDGKPFVQFTLECRYPEKTR
jgi:hypothetical protein